eukprot:3083135-Pyramimonas_sp.AAC.1
MGSRDGRTWKEEEKGEGEETHVVFGNEPTLGKLCMQGASKPGFLLETRQPFAKLHAGGEHGQGQLHVGESASLWGKKRTVRVQGTFNKRHEGTTVPSRNKPSLRER